jgi:hypothetical protein
LTTKKGFRAGTSRVRARSAPADGDGVGVRQLRSVVRKVAARPRRALRDENRRARGDPLRRRLREPDTHATDLWRFMSARRHRSRALQVLGRARSVRSKTRLPRASSASHVRFRDAGQLEPEAPRSSIRTHVAESSCQLRGRRPGTSGRTGRATRVSPRDPVEDSRSLTRAPSGDGLLAETAAGCWTRRSRACNPLVKDQHPDFASVAGRG